MDISEEATFQWKSKTVNGDQLCSHIWGDQENARRRFRNVHRGRITESHEYKCQMVSELC